MRRLGFILMAALGLTSCLSEPLWNGSPVLQGEVSINLRQEPDMTATKADDGLPEVDDFIVEVQETATSRLFFRKTYAEAQGVRIPLNKGEHRLFAYYGDPQKAGFKACYYAAETFFQVEANQLVQVDAVARLENAKVAVNFGPTLNFDYEQFYAEAVASNGAKLTFLKSEIRAGYVPVGEVSLNLYVYAQDKWLVYKTEPIVCEAGDFVTFNLDTKRMGDLSVEILIDNGVDSVVKEITVPAEAAPVEAPAVTVNGFEDNRFAACEADPTRHEGYKADIVAMGGIESCVLNISSSYLASKGIPSSVDLASLDPDVAEALKSVGFRFLRDMAGKRLAYVDFSGFINYVSQNVAYQQDYESSLADFSLTVTDELGRTAASQVYTCAIGKAQAEIKFNDYDIWATRLAGVTLNVTKGDPSKFVLKCVKASDMFYSSVQTIEPQAVIGKKVTFGSLNGLNAGTGYKIWAVYNGNTQNKTSEIPFTTETALQIGNNSFETFTVNTFKGTHTINWVDLWDSYSDPWWATNSSITLDQSNTSAYASYKSFPTVNMTSSSPHSGYYAITIASVAVGDWSSEWNLANSWGDAQVGEVFIGKADNSTEHNGSHVEDGHAFASRPSSMSYWYKLDSYESDPYFVEVKILDADGDVIGSAKKMDGASSVSSWTQVTLPIEYTVTDRKAAKIYMSFKSSSTGKTGSRKYSLSRYDYGEGSLNIHAGNILWLDDVKLNY